MIQDLSKYTAAYYEREQSFRCFGLLRSDQLAALCYALDWAYWGKEGAPEWKERDPGEILSVGAGRGELEAKLEEIGHHVTAVDPSPGAQELYKGKGPLYLAWTPEMVKEAKTIIFCESMEHIPIDQTIALVKLIQPGTRLIVVNFVDFWPIDDVGGWDHITLVNDHLYDQLSRRAQRIVLRRGSHLVLEF